MKSPVHYSDKTYTRKINYSSRFILIGNNFDGHIDFDYREFEGFEDLKANLQDILVGLKGVGEWKIDLYQVNQSYQVNVKYGYYRYPSRGKLIYSYSYMDCPLASINFDYRQIVFLGLEYSGFQPSELNVQIVKIKHR